MPSRLRSMARRRRLLAILPAIVPLLIASADEPEGPTDLERHQGSWAIDRSVRDGEDGPEEALRSIVRKVEGDRVVWSRDGESFAATRFEIDPDAEPKAIDLLPEGGPHRGERVLGIYRFEGDGRLTLCIAGPGDPRPSAFAAEAGVGTTLMTVRRLEDPVDDGPDAARPR